MSNPTSLEATKTKPFFEELLEGAQKTYKSPDPSSLGLTAQRTDYVIHHTLLPIAGVNGFILGLLWLYRVGAADSQLCIGSIAVLAALISFAILFWRRRITSDNLGLFLGAATICAILASLVLLPGWVGSAGAIFLVLVFSVAAGTLACRLPETSAGLVAMYIPVLLQIFRGQVPIERFVLETVMLLLLFVACHRAGFRQGQLVVLFSAVLVGIIEIISFGKRDVLFFSMFGVFVFLGIFYEWRLKVSSYSMLRRFLNSAPVVFLVWLALQINPWIVNDKAITWLWVGAVAVYQVMRAQRNGWVFEAGAEWIAFALFVAIWTTDAVPYWESHALLGLSVALMLHLLALREGNSFLAIGAILLLFATAFLSGMEMNESGFSPLNILVVLLVTSLALLVARYDRPKAIPWCAGLIAERHLDWLRTSGLAAAGLVLRIPLMATVFAWVRAGVLWIRYIKGPDNVLTTNDVLIATAHGYGAWALADQAMLVALSAKSPDWGVANLGSDIWIVWGAIVLLYGVIRELPFYRLLGACLVLTPVALTFWVWEIQESLHFALLLTIAGAALAIAGASFRIKRMPGTLKGS